MTTSEVGVEEPPTRKRRRPDVLAVISWPLTLALLATIVYPLILAFVDAFTGDAGFTIAPLRRLLADPEFFQALSNTGILLVTAGSLALIVAAVFAWLNERTDASFGAVSTLAPLIPLLMPPVALAVGWLFLAQERVGYLNELFRDFLRVIGIDAAVGPLSVGSWPGLIWVYTIALVPYGYMAIAPALRNMDTSLEEASRMSGAGPMRTWLRVSLPAIAPAIASAALLIVIIEISLFSIPRTIGSLARVKTISVYIVQLTQEAPSRTDEAVAVSVIMLILVGSVWLVHQWIVKKSRHSVISGKATTATVVRLGKWRLPSRILMILYFLSVAVLPLLALLIVALQPFWDAAITPSEFTLEHFRDFFMSPINLARQGLTNSLRLAAIGATVTVIAAALMATYAREVKGWRAQVVGGVTKAPAAISHLIIGVALLVAFSGPPFNLAGSTAILLIAYLVIYMPQASLAAEVARGQVGDELLEASYMSGASRGRTTVRILVPLMRSGLIYGWAMVFVLIMGDLTASAILSGPGNLVVGSVFLQIFESGAFAGLATLGFIVCMVSLVVVGLALTLRGRKSRPGDVKASPHLPTTG